MDPFGPKAIATSSVVASLLAYRAVKKKSLTTLGAAAGFVVGFTLVATGLRGMTLFFFYQIGSWATKYKKDVKAKMDETVTTSSVRGAGQVFAVSVTAVALSLFHAWNYGAERILDFDNDLEASCISAAVLAHHSVSLGDTLASELGMATSSSGQMVRLVLPPFPLVPPGTNGGMTWNGTIFSVVGGLLCGMFNLLMDGLSGILPDDDIVPYAIRVLMFASLCGGLGSLLDSLLGATVQMTYWDEEKKQICHEQQSNNGKTKQRKLISGFMPLLSNEGVNFVSVVMTTAIGWILAPTIF